MTVLARGTEKVRALEAALGGEPPRKEVDQSRADLERYVRERFERRQANWAKMRPLLEKAQAPLLELVRADAAAAKSIETRRNLILEQQKEKLTGKHSRITVEPQMVTGSGFWLKAPPYDVMFHSQNGKATASADLNSGMYSLGLAGLGGSSAASAGVGVWFFATTEDFEQRVAVPLDYDYSWLDSSSFYTAHNDAGTNIWVWGPAEGDWVAKQPVPPSWSDGTAWLDTHGSGGDGSEQIGRETVETFFHARASSWYLVWVWSEGSCDDAGSNLFGSSFAQQAQSMLVPWVVFGGL